MSGKLQNNNIYTIAKRNVEGQDMLYQSLKLTNGIWILAELRIQPGNPNYTVQSITRGGIWFYYSAETSLWWLLISPESAHNDVTATSPSPQLSLKCRAPEVSQYIYQMYDSVLKNWTCSNTEHLCFNLTTDSGVSSSPTTCSQLPKPENPNRNEIF